LQEERLASLYRSKSPKMRHSSSAAKREFGGVYFRVKPQNFKEATGATAQCPGEDKLLGALVQLNRSMIIGTNPEELEELKYLNAPKKRKMSASP
jgi:hypothetical protein